MTDAVFCLMDLTWPSWFWDFPFCSAPLSLFLSPSLWLLLFLFSSHFPLIHCDLKKSAILFCFLLNFKHNYCVIAGDKESVVVGVSLSFLTDTQTSALFSVGVYSAHSLSLFHNMISCMYWQETSVSIDTDNNMPVFGLLAFFIWSSYKWWGKKLHWVKSWTSSDLSACISFTSGCPCPWREQNTTWAVMSKLHVSLLLLLTISHCGHSTTPAPYACRWRLLSIRPGGWMALIGKICGPVPGLTYDWQ